MEAEIQISNDFASFFVKFGAYRFYLFQILREKPFSVTTFSLLGNQEETQMQHNLMLPQNCLFYFLVTWRILVMITSWCWLVVGSWSCIIQNYWYPYLCLPGLRAGSYTYRCYRYRLWPCKWPWWSPFPFSGRAGNCWPRPLCPSCLWRSVASRTLLRLGQQFGRRRWLAMDNQLGRDLPHLGWYSKRREKERVAKESCLKKW